MTPPRVLILDGNLRSALAATRALGRRRIPVVAADECPNTLAASSQYCGESFVYPSPSTDPKGFIAALQEETVTRDIRVIFPMSDITTSLLLEHRTEFTGVSIPFASLEAFEALTDKLRLVQLAQHLGVSVPVTHAVHGREDLAATHSHVGFPMVLKPYRSRIRCGDQWIAATVKYAGSVEELRESVDQNAYLARHPFLAQRYIRGEAQGVFALYNHGTAVAFFAHRRLREKPPSGGVSVLSESVEIDPRQREIARTLLDHVKWHGVAMVEFKVAPDGTPYLMEVNARFWGSLQLAVDAGVDFPYLLYKLALGECPEQNDGYRVGIRSRWLLGDLDHLYLRFRDASVRHTGNPSKWRALLDFLKFFEKNTRYEVNRWDDWKPFLVELRQYCS